MATGDSASFVAHLKSLLPGGWFASTAPLRDAVLGGIADDFAAIFKLLRTGKAFTRIKDTTGFFLDLVAWDFFGPSFLRMAAETDDQFRARIVAEVFRERLTRKGLTKALLDLTGQTPHIFEPANAADCGGGYGSGSVGSRIGYGTRGAYGSLNYPNQVFITARRPKLLTLPGYAGYGQGGGYGSPGIAYAALSQVQGHVTDADIYAAVARNKASGVTAWVAIEGGASTSGGPDYFFYNS